MREDKIQMTTKLKEMQSDCNSMTELVEESERKETKLIERERILIEKE